MSAEVRPVPRASLGDLPSELHALIARLIYLDSIPSGSLCTLDPLNLPSPNPLASSSSPPLTSTQAQTRKTLYALCLTSRSFYVAARPLLFRRVVVTLPFSFVLVLRTLGAAHLAQVYDKYAASGNEAFLLRDPAVPALTATGDGSAQQLAESSATAMAMKRKRERERTVTFEEMVAAAGFAHAAGGTLVIKARSRAGAALVNRPQSSGGGSQSTTEEPEMDLVWIEDPTSKSKSKRYHVHLSPFKPTALTLSNEELFAAHRFVRVIDFSRYTSQGMRRSVGDVSKNRFVTPAKLLALITAVSEFLESFGASETMDSALTCEILEALLFRDGEWAKPSQLRGVSIERRRSVSRHRGTSLTRLGSAAGGGGPIRNADPKMLQSLDLCNCVSPRFGEALTRFVQLYLRPRAVGITLGPDDMDEEFEIEPPSGPLAMHAEEEDDAATSTTTDTETDVGDSSEMDELDAEFGRGRRMPALNPARGRSVRLELDGVDQGMGQDDDEAERGRDTRSRRIYGSQQDSHSCSRSRTPFGRGSGSLGGATSSSSPHGRASSQSRLSAAASSSAAGGSGNSGSRLASPMVRRTSQTRSASHTRSRSVAFTPATFPSLRRLGLNGITFPMDIITPFVLAFPNLTHLDLSRTKTDGPLLRALASSDTLALRSLSLARCRSVDSESLIELLVRSRVCDSLVELSLEGTLIFPTSLTKQGAMTLIGEAPALRGGAMRFLDLSGCGLTDAHLAAFGRQPSLLDLGLGCNPRITLQGVAKLLGEKAPNVQVLSLQDSCMAGAAGEEEEEEEEGGDGPTMLGAARGGPINAAQLHQYLLAPCAMPPPVPLSQQLAAMGFKHLDEDNSNKVGSTTTLAASTGAPPPPAAATAAASSSPPRAATNLRVIELGASSLRFIRNGIETWKVVWGAGQRGWLVDMAAGPNPQAVFQHDAELAAASAAAASAGENGRGRRGRSGLGPAAERRGLGRELLGGGSGSAHSHSRSQARSRSRARSTSRVRAPGRIGTLETDDELESAAYRGGSSEDDDDDDWAAAGGRGRSIVGPSSGGGRGRGSAVPTYLPLVGMAVDHESEDERVLLARRDQLFDGADTTLSPPDLSSALSTTAEATAPPLQPLVARNEVVRSLPADHPRRLALEALGRAKGRVPGDTGWHSRKMEILLGFGFMGREAGSYALIAYQT
ncbi:hypothetical protein V8E36_003634 [Tilletia maclaganii]